jgi:hypothetical protein
LHKNKNTKVLNGRDKFLDKDSKKKVLKKKAPPLQKILKKKITVIDTGN